jgi:hypothetical protein
MMTRPQELREQSKKKLGVKNMLFNFHVIQTFVFTSHET